MECPGPFSTFFNFVQQHPPVWRREDQPDCSAISGAVLRRIDEKLVGSVPAFANKDARLFLGRKSLAEEVAAFRLSNGVITFNVQEFTHPALNTVTSWDCIQVRTGIFGLCREPCAGLRRFLLLRSEEHTSELQSLRHLVCRL